MLRFIKNCPYFWRNFPCKAVESMVYLYFIDLTNLEIASCIFFIVVLL